MRDAARRSDGVLAGCLLAWARGDDDVEAKAGALVVARFVNSVLHALKA